MKLSYFRRSFQLTFTDKEWKYLECTFNSTLIQGLMMKVFFCFPWDKKMLTLSVALEAWVSFHNVLSSSMQQTHTTEQKVQLPWLHCFGATGKTHSFVLTDYRNKHMYWYRTKKLNLKRKLLWATIQTSSHLILDHMEVCNWTFMVKWSTDMHNQSQVQARGIFLFFSITKPFIIIISKVRFKM